MEGKHLSKSKEPLPSNTNVYTFLIIIAVRIIKFMSKFILNQSTKIQSSAFIMLSHLTDLIFEVLFCLVLFYVIIIKLSSLSRWTGNCYFDNTVKSSVISLYNKRNKKYTPGILLVTTFVMSLFFCFCWKTKLVL